MQSRMEKYQYNDDDEKSKRTQRNEDLYKNIYENVEYTNIEGVVTSPKANEVDITKIKELLNNDEEKRGRIVKDIQNIEYPSAGILEEEKSYDIRDILSKAKEEKEDNNDKYRSFKNTEYDILKGINIKQMQEEKNQEEELKELIHTVTSATMINRMDDKSLAENLLSDLQGTQIVETSVETMKRAETDDIDRSFFTSSLGIQEKDFEELKDMNTAIKKDNKTIKIMLSIMLFFIILTTIFILSLFI